MISQTRRASMIRNAQRVERFVAERISGGVPTQIAGDVVCYIRDLITEVERLDRKCQRLHNMIVKYNQKAAKRAEAAP